MAAIGYRFDVNVLRHVREKKGYRIDVRTSVVESVCFSTSHPNMYIVENNCKDDIMVRLFYVKTKSNFLDPNIYTTLYSSPFITVKAGESRQIVSPEDLVCDIRMKSIVDTKYKTIRSRKSSRSHKAFSIVDGGFVTYYGVVSNVKKMHRGCGGKFSFLSVDHPRLAELSNRIRRMGGLPSE